MWRIFIPDKGKLAVGICYCALLLAYIAFIVVGVDLFFGISFITKIQVNRDPLSGAAWLFGFVIFTPLLGILTNACIAEDPTTQDNGGVRTQ